MKLTEKELNEFPIGTKITTSQWTYIKLGYDLFKSNVCHNQNVHTNADMLFYEITKVEIPNYTEYIPPKPILNDKEKEYLSRLVEPFKSRVKYIEKSKLYSTNAKSKEYIAISCLNSIDSFELPLFKNGTMYKGMEPYKEYTLDELRIIIYEREVL